MLRYVVSGVPSVAAFAPTWRNWKMKHLIHIKITVTGFAYHQRLKYYHLKQWWSKFRPSNLKRITNLSSSVPCTRRGCSGAVWPRRRSWLLLDSPSKPESYSGAIFPSINFTRLSLRPFWSLESRRSPDELKDQNYSHLTRETDSCLTNAPHSGCYY